MRLAVIADTHLSRRAADLPPTAWRLIRATDAVIHAGDVTEQPLLDALAGATPLHAVRGNNDHALPHLPERLDLTFAGVRCGVIHDGGASHGRRERLRALFPDARVVVFGHSHVPLVEDDGDLLLLNPGSPTDRRRMPSFTMALLTMDGDRRPNAELVDLGLERAQVHAAWARMD